jgi:lipid-binding SYLF domain-containing protein
MRSKIRIVAAAGLLAIVSGGLLSTGCATAPATEEKKAALSSEVQSAVSQAKAQDPDVKAFMDKAYGYAVFPSVGKGAVGIGGAYGRGEVFEQGNLIGYCDLTQATIGLQLGGQAYTEIICFQNKEALDNFKSGHLKFAAQASAVAIKAGIGANLKYTDGVNVMTMGESGLMYEASIGGQDFSFQPL